MAQSRINPGASSREGDNAAATQRILLDALSYPQAYPHPVEQVERVETHISTLLLAGDYVYKIKKALRFGFVDYSTLELRRFYCEEEVRLNSRYAPETYIGCVAIRGSADKPTWEGREPIIEYAVQMRRFDRKAQGDILARQGELPVDAMEGLGETIAGYHNAAPRLDEASELGLPSRIAHDALSNIEQLRDTTDTEITHQRLTGFKTWTRAQLRDLHDTFAQRRSSGFIRECHGDLHLANLIFRNGRWSAFDCIEFDEQLRWIDVMNDIAFTIMDLHAHNLPRLANRLINAYLAITSDYAGLAALRFYLTYRALVRAKVLALGAHGTDKPGERESLMQRHESYMATAATLAGVDNPILVITHGVSGSGKSWAARWAADRYGYVHIRSDVERKRLHDLPPEARTHSQLGQNIYTRASSRATYERMVEYAEHALRAGWPVILDATFLDRRQRDHARALAGRLHCPFHILTLETPGETARERVRARGKSDVSEATEEVLEGQLAGFRPLERDEWEDAVGTQGTEEELTALFDRITRHGSRKPRNPG